MKRDVLEHILWSLSVDRNAKNLFKEDPEKFLSRFPLGVEDKKMVLEFDVCGLQKTGVNPMLTLGYWTAMSPDRRVSSYNRKLGSNSGLSASIKR